MTPTSRAAFREYNSGILRARHGYHAEPFALSKLVWTQRINGQARMYSPASIEQMRKEVASW